MKKYIRIFAKWGRITGIVELMLGATLALYGYTLYYIGALPGLFAVISGIRLLRVSRSAKRLNYNLRFQQPDSDIYDETFRLLSSYLKMQVIVSVSFGIAIIVYLFLNTHFFTI